MDILYLLHLPKINRFRLSKYKNSVAIRFIRSINMKISRLLKYFLKNKVRIQPNIPPKGTIPIYFLKIILISYPTITSLFSSLIPSIPRDYYKQLLR